VISKRTKISGRERGRRRWRQIESATPGKFSGKLESSNN